MSPTVDAPARHALTEDQREFRDAIRAIVAARIAPRAAAIDATASSRRTCERCRPNTTCSACASGEWLAAFALSEPRRRVGPRRNANARRARRRRFVCELGTAFADAGVGAPHPLQTALSLVEVAGA